MMANGPTSGHLQAGAHPDGQRVLIVGLGRTGLSVARFLAARGVELAVTDSRVEPPALAELKEELPDVAVFVGGFDQGAFERADCVVISPGVSLREPAVAAAIHQGVPVIGDIELFARHAQAPVVAITGSNGKSTVTALLGEMARAAGLDVRIGGNFGTPALDLLQGPAPALYILELSSFQLETTRSLDARSAVVLNVSEDHMDRYGDLAEYTAAKAHVYDGTGVMVVNADDPRVAALARPGREIVRFGLSAPEAGNFGLRSEQGREWLCHGTERLLGADALRLRGRHNLANALAALALADAAGIPRAAQTEGLQRFSGLPHRMQWVAERDGVVWFNDSKATNVGAALAAIAGAPGERLVLIAGGEGKGQDFRPLRQAISERGRAAVLIGRDASHIESALQGIVPVAHAADMMQAVALASGLAEPGDSVLLAPACASFDMFRGFEHRGEAFVSAVNGGAA